MGTRVASVRVPAEATTAGARRVRWLTWRHPRLLVALKAACAGGIAWALVHPIGGFVHDYPYYAPLGAIVAMSTSVANSVRYSAQAVVSILIGGAFAILAMKFDIEDILAIGLIIGIGTVVAGWARLGAMGSWVPIAGLFVLVVGRTDPWQYVVAYAGLTAVGAVVGTAVNAALPQFPMTPVTDALAGLRVEMARQLDELADGLEADEQLSPKQWESWRDALDPRARRVDELMAQGLEARRGNWRAHRWRELAEHRQARAHALRYLVGCVEEVVALVSDPRFWLHDSNDQAATLRRCIAEAMRRTAAMIRSATEDRHGADEDAWKEADAAVRELHRVTVELGSGEEERYLPAAAVVVGLERAVAAWAE